MGEAEADGVFGISGHIAVSVAVGLGGDGVEVGGYIRWDLGGKGVEFRDGVNEEVVSDAAGHLWCAALVDLGEATVHFGEGWFAVDFRHHGEVSAKGAYAVCVWGGGFGVGVAEFSVGVEFFPVGLLGDGFGVGDGRASLLEAPGKLFEGECVSVGGDTVDSDDAFAGVAADLGDKGEVVEVVQVLLDEGVEFLDCAGCDVTAVVVAVGHEYDSPGCHSGTVFWVHNLEGISMMGVVGVLVGGSCRACPCLSD